MREQLEVYYLRSSCRSACVSYQFWAAGFELEEHLIFPTAERLTLDANGDLLYTFTRPWSDGTTGIKLSPLELLEKLSALVPLPRVHQVRYAGCLAAHRNLRGAITPTPSQRGIETQASPVASRWAWARLLKRVFALDLERCPRCPSGRLRIIAAITCRPVIRHLLRHLKLATDPLPLAPARLEPGRFAWTSV
jgi:Putative transposase